MGIEKIYLGSDAVSASTAPKLKAIKGVRLTYDDTVKFSRGDCSDSSAVLTVETPYATSTMATAIYDQVKNYQYQPLEATETGISPAVELGDAVTCYGRYTGIFKLVSTYQRGFKADIAAQSDEELDHEYTYSSTHGKYATYAGLKAGTTEVNGAGLTAGSVYGGYGGAIHTGSITTGETSLGINTSLNQGESAYLSIDEWVNGFGATLKGLYVTGQLSANAFVFNGQTVDVDDAGRLYVIWNSNV